MFERTLGPRYGVGGGHFRHRVQVGVEAQVPQHKTSTTITGDVRQGHWEIGKVNADFPLPMESQSMFIPENLFQVLLHALE